MSKHPTPDINIQTGYDAIRKRPGMYIGIINPKGFADVLLSFFKEFLEYDLIHIAFKRHSVTISIPKIQVPDQPTWYSFINLGTLISTSKTFSGSFPSKVFKILEKNISTNSNIQLQELPENSLKIEFTLDPEIWGNNFDWNMHFMLRKIQDFAYLHHNLKFSVSYLIDGAPCNTIFYFPNGLQDHIDLKCLDGLGPCLFKTHAHIQVNKAQLEVAFGFRRYSIDASYLQSYVNSETTIEHGIHVNGVLKGIINAFNKYFEDKGLTTHKATRKNVLKNILLAGHLKINEPQYAGCVKNKIINKGLTKAIAQHVEELFYQKIKTNSDMAKILYVFAT